MKIAITAANGQLGSAITKELIKQIGNDQVIAIARSPEKAEFLNVEVRKGDYNSKSDFLQALKGVDRLLVISGLASPDDRILQHRNILEASEANKVSKLVYTSIAGKVSGTTFDTIIQSNRQTEKDIQNSNLTWAIGRNGIYIEPDLDYMENYIKEGQVWNNAGDGKCAYTSRMELSKAYAKMLMDDAIRNKVFQLSTEPITQMELVNQLNLVYETNLTYKYVEKEVYLKERTAALGEFYGSIVAGIYQGINNGAFDVQSDFDQVCNRPHKNVLEMIKSYNKRK